MSRLLAIISPRQGYNSELRLLHYYEYRGLGKMCFYMLKSLDNVNRHTWVTDVKRLLFQYGFGYIWIAQDVGDSDIFIDTCARKMKAIYV